MHLNSRVPSQLGRIPPCGLLGPREQVSLKITEATGWKTREGISIFLSIDCHGESFIRCEEMITGTCAKGCKFNATMYTVLLVIHPGDLGLYYSHVTMKRRRQFYIVMQLRGVGMSVSSDSADEQS